MVRPWDFELAGARSSASPQHVEKRCQLMTNSEDDMTRSEARLPLAPGHRTPSTRRRSTGWCITGHRLRVSGARRCRDGYFGLEAVAAATAGPSGSVQRRDSARSNDTQLPYRDVARRVNENGAFDRPILENRAHGPIGSDDQTSSVQRLRRVGARLPASSTASSALGRAACGTTTEQDRAICWWQTSRATPRS